MGAFQPTHLIIVLVIIVLLFGGSKIPELMRGVGKGMGEFKKGIDEGKRPEEADDELDRLRAKRLALEEEQRKLAEAEEALKKR